MKYLFSLFFLFALCVVATAQESPTLDSVFITHDGTQFFQVRVQSFESGRNITERNPLGPDTAVAVNALVGLIYPGLKQFSREAVNIARIARYRSTIGATSAALMQVHGRNYFVTLGNLQGADFVGSYRLRINGGAPETCNVSQLANGSLRFQRQQGSTFVFDIITDTWVRIRDFDGVALLDLFYDGRVWISLNLSYQLVRL